MPSKSSKKKPAAALPKIPTELIDQFVSGPMTAEAVNAASMAFKKALIERALGAELSHHLGYSPGAEKPAEGAASEIAVIASICRYLHRSSLNIWCDVRHHRPPTGLSSRMY